MPVPGIFGGGISFYGNNASPPYDGIWSIANPGNPTQTNESLRDLLAYDYFHGPNGGNNVNFNGWGTYTGTSGTAGDSRIYNMSYLGNSSNTNYQMVQCAGLDYYYDATPPGASTYYYSRFFVDNQCANPGDDININIYFGNPFGNFPYLNGGGNVPFGTNQTFDLSNSGSPLINNGYWYFTFSTGPGFNGTASGYTLTINGTTLTTGALGAGINVVSDNWTSFATIETINLWGGVPYAGFDVTFTIR